MSFWKKLLSVILCAFLLTGYNAVALSRDYEEKLGELNAKVKSLQAQVDYDSNLFGELNHSSDEKDFGNDTMYKDGEYEGSAQGYGGSVTVKVTIKKDEIKSIDIVSAEKEDASYLTMAMKVISDMLAMQSPEVDTVSGATMTSTGIKNAVMLALNDALNE